jgi:uncharacterized protein (DUF433 family)
MKVLGEGMYILAEVARLTRMHPNRVKSWFKPHVDGSGYGPIFASDYEAVGSDYAVSFFDLIDVLIAGQFRDHHKVPMRVVRRAHKLLSKQLGTKHPFCHSKLYTDGESIFLYTANELNEATLREVVSQQQFFLHIREKLSEIEYCDKTEMARRWNIGTGVVVDPAVCMGKPVVARTGVATHIIANQFYANRKDSALVADLYGISETDVANAVKFEGWYRGRDAA